MYLTFCIEDENFISKDIGEYIIVGIVSGQSLSYEPYYKRVRFFR